MEPRGIHGEPSDHKQEPIQSPRGEAVRSRAWWSNIRTASDLLRFCGCLLAGAEFTPMVVRSVHKWRTYIINYVVFFPAHLTYLNMISFGILCGLSPWLRIHWSCWLSLRMSSCSCCLLLSIKHPLPPNEETHRIVVGRRWSLISATTCSYRTTALKNHDPPGGWKQIKRVVFYWLWMMVHHSQSMFMSWFLIMVSRATYTNMMNW